MQTRKIKGQSTFEYLIILTAIVGVIIWAAGTLIKPAVQTSLTNAESAIGSAADALSPE